MTTFEGWTIEEMRDWIDRLEVQCDGLEDGCTELFRARVALENLLSYEIGE